MCLFIGVIIASTKWFNNFFTCWNINQQPKHSNLCFAFLSLYNCSKHQWAVRHSDWENQLFEQERKSGEGVKKMKQSGKLCLNDTTIMKKMCKAKRGRMIIWKIKKVKMRVNKKMYGRKNVYENKLREKCAREKVKN